MIDTEGISDVLAETSRKSQVNRPWRDGTLESPIFLVFAGKSDTDGANYFVKNLSGLMTEQRLVTLPCLFIFTRLVVADIDKLLTNNPMAVQHFATVFDVDFREGSSAVDVLKAVRDMVHLGHRLHTHPVTSGTAPDGNPFVSVVLSAEPGVTDFDSVGIIEGAVGLYTKLGRVRELPQAAIDDFMLINCDMLAKDTQNIQNISDKEGTI